MLIGEMGSTEQGGSKASWIDEALTAIPAYYPQIRGLLWFDTYDDGMDWPIETSASSRRSLRRRRSKARPTSPKATRPTVDRRPDPAAELSRAEAPAGATSASA